MTPVAEHAAMPLAIPLEAPVPLPLPVNEQEATPQPALWRRVGAGMAMAGVLLAGACSSPAEKPAPVQPSHSVEHGVGPDIAHNTPPPEAPQNKIKAAQAGPLGMGMVIVRPKGASAPPYGLNKKTVTAATIKAENDINAATMYEVTFKKPTFYGSIEVPMPKGISPNDACKVEKDTDMPDKPARDAIIKATMENVRSKGYVDEKNVGLLMFMDMKCEHPSRSFANQVGGMLAKNNAMYITVDPRQKQTTLPHEIGHELGNNHANQLIHSGTEVTNEFTPQATSRGYGNPRSIMGNPAELKANNIPVKFNGYELYTMGAIQLPEIRAINKPGSYPMTLTDINHAPGDTPKLLALPRAGKTVDGLDHWWVELSRAPVTDDAKHGKSETLGVCVYAGDAGQGNKGGPTDITTLEYFGQAGQGCATEALEQWTIFQDTVSGITIKLNSIDQKSGTARITVNYTGTHPPLYNRHLILATASAPP
ncbi:MAG TPA: hypothetical protein VLF62_03860 [Candidatus Saccharimonadales bacterium]|nr:hypothetical protein [Candidatus Saccharimonadales bacterium]